jgi:predicted nucleotide-binding protein (sugar kinase/HSP70/actin superfamily)
VVGEIFCRLNTFSNEDLIRKLESYGAEACLSHISEWVEYTNNEAEAQAAPDRAKHLHWPWARPTCARTSSTPMSTL